MIKFCLKNIARSPTRFFKTQKCPEPNCIKWLAEYTPESATDPTAVTDKPEGLKVSLKSVIAQYEENEAEEDEDRYNLIFNYYYKNK